MSLSDFKNDYEFQGAIMITLSLFCGLYGRFVISKGDSARSERVCWMVVGVKTVAIGVFAFFQLRLSLYFTIFMTVVWFSRGIKFRRKRKDEILGVLMKVSDSTTGEDGGINNLTNFVHAGRWTAQQSASEGGVDLSHAT